MALNPPISYGGIPLRVSDEYILLERKGTELELKVPGMKTISMKGKLFLTSARLVFVTKNFAVDQIKAVDMPIALMKSIDFKQPIFGSNYLKFTQNPLLNLLPAPGSVKIWFTEGGCEKFLKIFDVTTNQINEQIRRGQFSHSQNFNQQIQNGFFANSGAYQDRSDPSLIYVTQPAETLNNTNQFYGTNYLNTNYPTAPGPGPQQYPSGPQQYPSGPQQYPSGPQQYPAGPQQYPAGPQQYPAGPQQYPAGPNQHNSMQNAGAYTQAYQGQGVSYYFGVPLGPRLEHAP